MKSALAIVIAYLSITISANRTACVVQAGLKAPGFCVVYSAENDQEPTKERYRCFTWNPCYKTGNGCIIKTVNGKKYGKCSNGPP
ncbi:hypothetical protein EG327_003360 [Venturia inaequalis]|uniref:Secreted protein n=1 Tax=Venturia inaequalis TaxID=5025 RepID=A0A8H3VGQ4_VENIN|nr:hypothetical protein EG327_003360 [Venturia inaequalis]